MTAAELVRSMGVEWSREAVLAGRRVLRGDAGPYALEDVRMVSALEAHHVAVEELAHALGECRACLLKERERDEARRDVNALYRDLVAASAALGGCGIDRLATAADDLAAESRRVGVLWVRDKIRSEFFHRNEPTIGRAWLDSKLSDEWPALAAAAESGAR